MEIRKFTSIGKGQETEVFSSQRGGKESTVVIKEYDGINGQMKQVMEQQYVRLQSVYGDIIPRQRFMKKPGALDTVVLVQQKIQPAQQPNLLDCESNTLPTKTQEQLERLIHTLKAQYRIFLQDKNAVQNYTLLDFAKKANLLLTTDGDIKYPDTGILQTYARLSEVNARRMIQIPIATMELIAGRSAQDIQLDPEYSELLRDYKRGGMFHKDLDGKTAFERWLRGVYDLKGVLLI